VRVNISSRKSDLARIQAYSVGQALQKKFPQLEVQYHFRESLGDKNLTDPLWKMPEKGVFTEDFYEDIVSEKTDLIVHSWKDLPVQDRPETVIAGTLPRVDSHDVLLLKTQALGKPNLKIFSSSPRRSHNLSQSLPKLLSFETSSIVFEPVRGNIATRLTKWMKSENDGIILAKAAIDRILSVEESEFLEGQKVVQKALAESLWMILPLSINPTAAAQGALAIEVKKNRKDILDLVAGINDQKTFDDVELERKILQNYGGG
jgi:hydroxymethylbilane synthase